MCHVQRYRSTVCLQRLYQTEVLIPIIMIYRVGHKSKPDNFCNNFVYCQPISIILAHIHYRKFATRRYIVSPPNTVCVTALPCKILITTLPICLYMFTTINNNKYKLICTLDIIYVKKRHNADYGTLLKCYPWP